MSASMVTLRELKSLADYQQLVDDVDSLLKSPSGVDPEAVSRLHADFDHAVKLVNARLRECDQLLRKGLIDEALQLSKAAPNLLEVFLIVDFPELDSWEETVRQCGLTPTELLVNVASDLIDADQRHAPLADLKYQVRLHALARSPLPIRINLMRQLSKLDHASTVWDDDLKVFEKARQNELAGDCESARKAGDIAALTKLQEELQSPDWQSPPQKNLLKQVTDSLTVLRAQHARAEMQRLEPELLAAFTAYDVSRGRELRQQWRKAEKLAALPPSDPLVASVAEAMNWLEQQDQQDREQLAYDDAVAALSGALDNGSERLVLQEKYHALISLERGIPQALEERLKVELKRIESERNWKFRLAAAAVVIMVSLIGVLAVASVRNAIFQKQVATQAANLQQLIEQKQLQKAEEHLADLEAASPAIANAQPILTLKTDLSIALEHDRQRRQKFRALLDSARRDGVDSATRQTILTALEALSQAWDLALTTGEKSEVQELSKLVEEQQARMQQRLNDEFTSDVERLDQQFKELREEPLNHLGELEGLKEELKLVLDREGVPNDLQAKRGRPLLAKINQSIASGTKQKREAEFLSEIDDSVGDRAKFFAQMDRYLQSKEFVGTTRHNDFEQVLKSDAPLLTGFLSWREFLNNPRYRDLSILDLATARKFSADAEKLIKEHPGFAFIPSVQESVNYVKKMEVRRNGSKLMEELLGKKFFDFLAARVKRNEGDIIYYFSPPAPSKDGTDSVTVKHFVDSSEFKETKTARLTNAAPAGNSDWDSPQLVFKKNAVVVLERLRERKGDRWDQAFIELLGRLFENEDLDPILKVQLIPVLIRAAGEGSSFLPDRLKDVEKAIDDAKLNPQANWVLPGDEEAAAVRGKAVVLLKRLATELRQDKLRSLSEEADQVLASWKQPRFDVDFVWEGWLHRAPNGKWTCTWSRGSPQATEPVNLFLLIKSDEGTIRFKQLGHFQQGQLMVTAEDKELLEGRPVFQKASDGAPAETK